MRRKVIEYSEQIPQNMKMTCVKIRGCQNSREPFKMRMVRELSEDFTDGVCSRAIWKVSCDGLPNRYVLLMRGKHSVDELLDKYSFFDSNGCIFTKDNAEVMRANINAHLKLDGKHEDIQLRSRKPIVLVESTNKKINKKVPCHVAIKDIGIPQNSVSSGICWWGSMWFALCFCYKNKNIILKYIESSNVHKKDEYHYLITNMLSSKDSSEKMRALMYDELGIGDNPRQNPLLDGQNGYSQFSLMCTAFNIPLITYIAPWLSKKVQTKLRNSKNVLYDTPPEEGNHGGFVGIRTYRGDHIPSRTLMHNGKKYILTAALIGSEYCGHQIAIASTCDDTNKWAFYDSDALRTGIGPISWHISEGASDTEWWKVLHDITPIINKSIGTKYCDMNPHNRHPLKMLGMTFKAENKLNVLEKHITSNKHNLVNMDWIYAYSP